MSDNDISYKVKTYTIEVTQDVHDFLTALLEAPGCPVKSENDLLRQVCRDWQGFWKQIVAFNHAQMKDQNRVIDIHPPKIIKP